MRNGWRGKNESWKKSYDSNADINPVLAPDGAVNLLDATLVNAHWGETAE